MITVLRFILTLTASNKLAGNKFFPMPYWLRVFLNRYPMSRRITIYSQLCKGVDLSMLAPDELGCAESVSRLLNILDDRTPIVTGTWTLNDYILKNGSRFEILKKAEDGCIVMAVTGTGNGILKNGHVGFYVKGRVLSNNSYTGEWDDHYSIEEFVARYHGLGGFIIRFYKVKN